MTGTVPATPWTACVLSLFPEMFPGPLGLSLAGRGLERDLRRLRTIQIRDFATDRHASVDDAAFGGGRGLVMRPDVLDGALAAAPADLPRVYLSPRGKLLDQQRIRALAEGPGVTLLCGRYEGIDQRVIDHHRLEEISLGDFILSGGEIAALALMDACIRLVPGVLAEPETLIEESFEMGLLEYPHYTRPADWRGMAVPDVLLSGHHQRIRDWRRHMAERITAERRPDLWTKYCGARTGASH